MGNIVAIIMAVTLAAGEPRRLRTSFEAFHRAMRQSAEEVPMDADLPATKLQSADDLCSMMRGPC